MNQNKIKPNEVSKKVSKKYQCECIDCVGEWTGLYKNIEDLEKDIKLYCRSGKVTFKIIELPE